MFWPCETRTSTCRNFATISSGVYRFFGIAVLLHVKRHSSGRTTSKGEDHQPCAIARRQQLPASQGCDGGLVRFYKDTNRVAISVFADRFPLIHTQDGSGVWLFSAMFE